MFDFSCFTYNWLWFTRPTEEPSPAPAGLERIWIPTPGGRIEVLAAIPPKSADADTDTKPSGPPIVFCHGGMGGAWVWTEYMTYLAQRGVRSYAVSLRGHGDSWYPSYLAMVFGTTRSALASDFVAAVKAVEEREGEKVLLVGHSSGGGLSQDILAKGLVTARGLALLGAVPCYGSTGVYMNWVRLDPWCSFRMVFHGYHPNSPLSHPELTRRAFFGDSFPATDVVPFQRRMNRYESFWWPLTMMRPFASAQAVLAGIENKGAKTTVLVMAGSQDALMDARVTRETTAFYRAASDEENVRIEFVNGAGHHLQNDVQWEDGAAKLLDFWTGL